VVPGIKATGFARARDWVLVPGEVVEEAPAGAVRADTVLESLMGNGSDVASVRTAQAPGCVSPVYRYTFEGTQHWNDNVYPLGPKCTSAPVTPGQPVDVYVNPAQPWESALTKDAWGEVYSGLWLFFGVVVILPLALIGIGFGHHAPLFLVHYIVRRARSTERVNQWRLLPWAILAWAFVGWLYWTIAHVD
jgi:hypothetical protein